MTFFDFLKDLNDTAKERLKTPITGAFFFSFVLWNWRPIVLLIFSEQSIEDRIQIIDQYFCTTSALVGPVGIALFYIIVIPIVMIAIDWTLVPIKEKRRKLKYDNNNNEYDAKIKFAAKQLELKNAESGNKQIEDFQRQIKELEDSKDQLSVSHNNTVKQLNDQLAEANEVNKKSHEIINSLRSANEDIIRREMEMMEVPPSYLKTFKSMTFNTMGMYEGPRDKFSNEFISVMVGSGYLKIEHEKLLITFKGEQLLKHLERHKDIF